MKNKTRNIYWLFLLIIFPFPILISLVLNYPSDYQEVYFPVFFGSLAYAWLLLTLNLGCKPKWLDKKIGLLNVYLIHGLTAILVLIIINLHKALVNSTGLPGIIGEIGSFIFTLVVLISLLTQAGWLTERYPLLLKGKKWISQYVSHERSVWLHRGLIIATVVITLHFSLVDFVRAIPVFFPLMILYFLLTLINYSVYYYNYYKKRPQGLVKNIQLLDQKINQITIEIPNLTHEYQAGQFVFIAFPEVEGLAEAHPFSIVKADYQRSLLTFAMLDCGDYTHALTNLKMEDHVNISKPYGILPDVIHEVTPTDTIVFIIGGIGITPFISLINQIEQNVYVFYSVSQDKEFLYPEVIDSWRKKENIQLSVRKHRFTSQEILEAIPEDPHSKFIIAGPMAMNLQFEKDFKEKGISKDRIFYESFTM